MNTVPCIRLDACPRRRQLPFVMALVAAAFGGSVRLGAQDALPTLADVTPKGAVVPRVQSRTNPKATYAVYLPSSYTRDKRWPVLILMDPRGRALIPMELFREPAERLGYIVLSSYDTQSDGSREPNDMALDAILGDVQRYLPLDAKRLYLAGFSGTARFAWDVSDQLPSALAGILGFGAGTPGDKRWLAQHVHGAPFDYYGAVGNVDPNYIEMRQLARDLAEARIPFHIDGFDGPHAWPPAATCRRALEWMELRAMDRRLRPVDSAWVDSLAAARRRLLPPVDPPTADGLRARRDWLQDFAPSQDTTAVAREAAALAANPGVRQVLQREDALEAKDLAWMRGYFEFLTALKRESPPPDVGQGKRRASIDELVKLAGSQSDSLGAVAGRRGIARILVYATFYEFRDYLATHQWDRAETLLKVAEAANGADGGVCFALARVQAQLDRPKESLAHLECAERAGILTHELMRHPLLEPVRADPRFTAIDARLTR
ncbi:MAG: hypothetical protein U0163_11060 [Gemmatimonadaceae bacterium]